MSQRDDDYAYEDEEYMEDDEQDTPTPKREGGRFVGFMKGLAFTVFFAAAVLWLGEKSLDIWNYVKDSQQVEMANQKAYQTAEDVAKGQYSYNAEHFIGPGKEYAVNVEDLSNGGMVPWNFDADIVEMESEQSEQGDTYRAEVKAEGGTITYVVTSENPEPVEKG